MELMVTENTTQTITGYTYLKLFQMMVFYDFFPPQMKMKMSKSICF